MNVFIRTILVLGIAGTIENQVEAQDLSFTNSASNSTLVELYSSEGCSSCPPAEAWLGRLTDSQELWHTIFPLSFHVDYWDNLGWPDRFARPAYTERQRTYAASSGRTPFIRQNLLLQVVNGEAGFTARNCLPRRIRRTERSRFMPAARAPTFRPATRHPRQRRQATYTINVVLLGFNVVSDVKRGENGGRGTQTRLCRPRLQIEGYERGR